MPFAIKNLLNGERGFGGGQRLAAAFGALPPTAFALCIELVSLFTLRKPWPQNGIREVQVGWFRG
jgi:hypothetical protein